MMSGGNVEVGCKELFTMLGIGSNNQAREMQSCVESSAWNSSGPISAKRVQLELSRLRQIAIIMDSVMVYRKGEPGSIVAPTFLPWSEPLTQFSGGCVQANDVDFSSVLSFGKARKEHR